MDPRILLLIGVCVQIAVASDCNRKADLSLDTMGCCLEAWHDMDILNDPCFHSVGETEMTECMLDCFYTSHGFLTNGSIVLENGIRYLRSFGSKEFQDMFIGAFERCSKFDWNELTAKFGHLNEHGDTRSPKQTCSPKASTFDSCIALNVISRCPEHMWIKNDHCTSEKNFLNECIFVPLNKN